MKASSAHTLASTLALLVASSLSASAAPLVTRAPNAVDLVVLQFADLLEHLEETFYQQALAKFHPVELAKAGFIDGNVPKEQLDAILSDEGTHVSFLDGIIKSLGKEPLGAQCQYDFTGALKDVSTMISTARILEVVGVGAYEGGAILVTDKTVLAGAGKILPVEARHASLLNTFDRGDFSPNPFEIALTPESVLSLAAPFVKGGCDIVGTLGLTPQPGLMVKFSPPHSSNSSDRIGPGSYLEFRSAGPDSHMFTEGFCQIRSGQSDASVVLPIHECVIPVNIKGVFFVYLTQTADPIPASIVDRLAVPAADRGIIAGPAIGFVDPDEVEALVDAIRKHHGEDY